MEYYTVILFFTFILTIYHYTDAWDSSWTPNFSKSYLGDSSLSLIKSEGDDIFKLLMTEGDQAYIGAKNKAYVVSLSNLQNFTVLSWDTQESATSMCIAKGKEDACYNYIRVMVRLDDQTLYVCGTNAYQPKCRKYRILKHGKFEMVDSSEEGGVGVCPYDPNHNSTALISDGLMYTATVSDSASRDPLILRKSFEKENFMRTKSKDSMFFNEPSFVSSHDKDDKMFFFFRETAVENINCGKAVFSRVGRVCKQDHGGGTLNNQKNFFTSFFKARLNCSVPGQYPFYFDEILSTTEFNKGNYRPTTDSGDRSDMVYGVFTTPDNSIRGSAVCAFRLADIQKVFEGRFKGQESHKHNWLPVSWSETPTPHPEKCSSKEETRIFKNINFIKMHPLMDEAVPATGGQPMVLQASFNYRFTHVAVDWQVRAADGHYYDVLFVGTDDGRVIKSINKGRGPEIETVIIEELQILDKSEPVVSLKVHSGPSSLAGHLMVVSKTKVVSVPLHRCNEVKSCGACVSLQDPYCAWNSHLSQCVRAEQGYQNIQTGKHKMCPKAPDSGVKTTPKPVGENCNCGGLGQPGLEDKTWQADAAGEKSVINVRDDANYLITENNEFEARAEASKKRTKKSGISDDIFVISLVASIIVSLVIGFFIGFKVQACWQARNNDNVFTDRNCSSLQRGRNRLSSGDNAYFHTDHSKLTKKQMNCQIEYKNGKTNSSLESPMTKSSKVYI